VAVPPGAAAPCLLAAGPAFQLARGPSALRPEAAMKLPLGLMLALLPHREGLCRGAVTEEKLNSTFLLPSDFDSFHLSTWSVDFGKVADEPLMMPEHEWDEEIGGKGTILVDPIDRLYKAWYISQPGINYTTYNSSEGASRMISYAYSHDGVSWTRPLLDVVLWNGQPSNILLQLPNMAECSYANVYVDPAAANKSRTYEMLALMATAPPGFPKKGKHQAIYRYYSSDGIQFEADTALTDGPCHGRTWCSDSMYINKRPDNSYLALLKHGPKSGATPGGIVPYDIAAGGTRWIYVSNSSDGVNWEPAALALAPDWRDGAGFQVISSISTIGSKPDPLRRPLGPLLIGWLPVFDSLSQTIDMQFAISESDGREWWRPERRSAVQYRELGFWGGGMMWPYRLFVRDRDDPSQLHAYFSGCQGRHADIHSTLAGERFEEVQRSHCLRPPPMRRVINMAEILLLFPNGRWPRCCCAGEERAGVGVIRGLGLQESRDRLREVSADPRHQLVPWSAHARDVGLPSAVGADSCGRRRHPRPSCDQAAAGGGGGAAAGGEHTGARADTLEGDGIAARGAAGRAGVHPPRLHPSQLAATAWLLARGLRACGHGHLRGCAEMAGG
jgi:hypothetical protein